MRGILRSPAFSPRKGQWRRALMSSGICAGTNGWINNQDAGDLRRHRAHCDVTVMFCQHGITVPQWSFGLLQPITFFSAKAFLCFANMPYICILEVICGLAYHEVTYANLTWFRFSICCVSQNDIMVICHNPTSNSCPRAWLSCDLCLSCMRCCDRLFAQTSWCFRVLSLSIAISILLSFRMDTKK